MSTELGQNNPYRRKKHIQYVKTCLKTRREMCFLKLIKIPNGIACDETHLKLSYETHNKSGKVCLLYVQGEKLTSYKVMLITES